MNIDKLRKEIEHDEGCVYEVYLDHLGLPTFGIGHLIISSDPESEYTIGYPVVKERVIQAFEEDIQIVLNDCSILFPYFYDLLEEVQHIIANMMFNMGRPRLSKFVKFKEAIEKDNWKEAAIQMEDSNWYRQVTKRAGRLIKRMQNITISWGNPTVDME